MWKKNPVQFWVKSKYFGSLGNKAEAEALVHIQDDFPLPLVPARLPAALSTHTKVSVTSNGGLL